VFGRASTGDHRVEFWRQRPGRNEYVGQIEAARISRDQLLLTGAQGQLAVRNVGRLPLYVNDRPADHATLEEGDVLEIDREILLLVVRRPATLAPIGAPLHSFGGPDEDGIVGESPAIWALRRRVTFCAAASDHLLICGASGKESVAQGLHRRAGLKRPMVSRNASTLPESLLDAELYGNLRDYPNPGMPERRGLIGEADGSTLFLDEIGEIPHEAQAHLLRVLDTGEYQRLGETRMRTAHFRLIGATNRSPETPKHDFAARLTMRIDVPGLEQRREDIPFLVRHVLGKIVSENPGLFRAGTPEPHRRLVGALVRYPSSPMCASCGSCCGAPWTHGRRRAAPF
jgi:two-component system, NtrC family, response regulator HydG